MILATISDSKQRKNVWKIMRVECLTGVCIKTHSPMHPFLGLGGGLLGGREFKEVITQYSELLDPQIWNYSDFEKHIGKDELIEKSILYEFKDLKIIYGYLVKEAQKQMDHFEHQQTDYFQKIPVLLTAPLHLVKLEVEGKQLEINWWFSTQRGVRSFIHLCNIIKDILEEIKSEGALGVLFYSKEIPNWRRFSSQGV